MIHLFVFAQLATATPPIRLDPDSGWVMKGDVRVVQHLGRRAIQLKTGVAYRPDIAFSEGTIEFDMAPLTNRRSFIGIGFRMTTPDDYEDVYFRPHASGAWDALQYDGVWNGAGSWQLYWGPGATAPVPFFRDRWTGVRIVVRGERAEIYYDGADSAALVVPELKRGGAIGFVGLWGFYPNAGTDTSYVGSISNIVLYPGVFRSGTAPIPAIPSAVVGTLMRWRLSTPVATGDAVFAERAPTPGRLGPWKTVEAERSGLVNIPRVAGTPNGGPRALVYAQVSAVSRTHQRARLNVGYSDDIAVYLNGSVVYTGINGFGSRYALFLGMVRPEFEAVYLNLKPGRNDITLAIRDDFRFGWGFIGRLTAPQPLTISP